ncbi:UDP-N-acetylmuramoyl-L-alanyl-D-glutamate--2,6-diaminopimelate ligase [Salinicola aestuarinus]|uniref:UDP-N-acetylmuramoyl-L-alanyl-D-glutamate--2, 6-diaminopimelate ligase n=1 Tax=Salinicola aestuarinus TaxID=1949082 RepID=UPI000DA119B0|nr:UDP-N-acetylmuramoyl-L-alanyl-D-glutamate--2,6-diaminopimelate ligase [Salinicola aestuarinus]
MRVQTTRLVAALEALEYPEAANQVANWCDGHAELALIQDSREVAVEASGALPVLFLATPGVATDGREHIEAALSAGAVGVLAEGDELAARWQNEARVVSLPGITQQLAALGRVLFDVPETLRVIGVTGTNGKSSVTHYIAALLERLGHPAAVVGTLGYGRPDALRPALQTTPGPLALQQMLGEMAAEGVETVAMEVSSHALAQDRLGDTRVDTAVFTNLSRDHLDYHVSMAAYAAAKAKLFQRDGLRLAVVNGDDPLARLMLAGLPAGVRVLATGSNDATTLRVAGCEALPEGLRAVVASPEDEHVLELPLMGRFNLDNALLAMTTLYGLGHSLESIWPAAAELTPVPGRMQRVTAIDEASGPAVIVDYAHTPAALDNALAALREHLPGGDGSALWCIFGCGGDRDPGKRVPMAEAVERHADRVVITDDNPRGESAEAIRDAVSGGLQSPASAWSIGGRRDAIERVIAEANDHDIVLIAGKGHEDYQEIAGVRQPFDDREVARSALQRRGALT